MSATELIACWVCVGKTPAPSGIRSDLCCQCIVGETESKEELGFPSITSEC